MRNVNAKLRAAIAQVKWSVLVRRSRENVFVRPRPDILRREAVGVLEPIESGIAITAAERTDFGGRLRYVIDGSRNLGGFLYYYKI